VLVALEARKGDFDFSSLAKQVDSADDVCALLHSFAEEIGLPEDFTKSLLKLFSITSGNVFVRLTRTDLQRRISSEFLYPLDVEICNLLVRAVQGIQTSNSYNRHWIEDEEDEHRFIAPLQLENPWMEMADALKTQKADSDFSSLARRVEFDFSSLARHVDSIDDVLGLIRSFAEEIKLPEVHKKTLLELFSQTNGNVFVRLTREDLQELISLGFNYPLNVEIYNLLVQAVQGIQTSNSHNRQFQWAKDEEDDDEEDEEDDEEDEVYKIPDNHNQLCEVCTPQSSQDATTKATEFLQDLTKYVESRVLATHWAGGFIALCPGCQKNPARDSRVNKGLETKLQNLAYEKILQKRAKAKNPQSDCWDYVNICLLVMFFVTLFAVAVEVFLVSPLAILLSLFVQDKGKPPFAY